MTKSKAKATSAAARIATDDGSNVARTKIVDGVAMASSLDPANPKYSSGHAAGEDTGEGYRVNDWAGRKNYACNSCGFASLDEETTRSHVALKHFPTAVGDEAAADTTPPADE